MRLNHNDNLLVSLAQIWSEEIVYENDFCTLADIKIRPLVWSIQKALFVSTFNCSTTIHNSPTVLLTSKIFDSSTLLHDRTEISKTTHIDRIEIEL